MAHDEQGHFGEGLCQGLQLGGESVSPHRNPGPLPPTATQERPPPGAGGRAAEEVAELGARAGGS